MNNIAKTVLILSTADSHGGGGNWGFNPHPNLRLFLDLSVENREGRGHFVRENLR